MSEHVNAILQTSPVIPVLAINNLSNAVPLASALVKGGIKVLEITLRTPIALDAIRLISDEVEGAIVGVGTVITPKDMEQSANAGAVFAVSPGLTEELSRHSIYFKDNLPLLPGVSTPSELMRAMESGFETLKFFPAEAAGGQPMLKSFFGPFPNIKFCPTGGVTPHNAPNYLSLPNVLCVGGSWLAPKDAIAHEDWRQITKLAQHAAKLKRG